jgi:glucosyl-3-phosphoglycerate synthase
MITVIIPVLNECQTISSVIRIARASSGVTEVLVVDDGSIDGTPEQAAAAGAKVLTSTLLGKGASMEDGVRAATNEYLVFLDGDLLGLRHDLISVLTEPLLANRADLVKSRFTRSAGRVTLLAARPLLKTFFPELSFIEQPLAGIIAIRRALLKDLLLESDYGVDIGLLLDAASRKARIEQVDIGHIDHDSQSLEALGDMARQVVRVILDRAARNGRLNSRQVEEGEELERHAKAGLVSISQTLGRPAKLALFDMDGTLLNGRFALCLAEHTGRRAELDRLLDREEIPADQRTRQIAAVFQGIARSVFEDVAKSIPLSPGAVETVVGLRKLGYRIGVVSDSFAVATEVVRRRVFADFSVAHLMKFGRGVASGDVTLSPAMYHTDGCPLHQTCKKNVLLRLCEQFQLSHQNVLAVGDGTPDTCMLQAAGISVAFEPKSQSVRDAGQYLVTRSLIEVLNIAQRVESEPDR